MPSSKASGAPRWSLTRWLLEPGGDLPADIRSSLVASLYGSIPIFAGGVLNTIAVSTVIAARIPTVPFLFWAFLEISLAAVRLPVLMRGRRAIAEGRKGPTSLYIFLALTWAASVGYGTFISVASGDWVAATLACLSAAAMVGGICFRNFAAPRLVAVMIALSLGPCAVASVFSGQSILLVVGVQIPVYLYSMTMAALHLNRLLVRTMKAERFNDHHARHDSLTQVLNRRGLAQWVETWGGGARSEKQGFALFYLDLDGFKQVNDTLGHAAGDALLKSVVGRLEPFAVGGGALARLGGDEFVLVAPRCDFDRIAGVGMEIVDAICADGYRFGDDMAFVGASVGAVRLDEDGVDLDTLLSDADRALYSAKSHGGWRCAIASEGRPLLTPKSVRPPGAATPWMPWQTRSTTV